jgi:hypothetical protein
MPKKHRAIALVAAIAASIFASGSLANANLLTNGSFETGDFSGWTGGGNFEDTEVVTATFYAYLGAQDGSFYAVLGPVGSDATLSQTFSDIAGHTLQVSGYYSGVGDDPSDLSALFNGAPFLSLSDPNTGGVYTQFSFDVTATGSDTFSLSFRDDPAFIAIDNFVITDISSIPEPASLGLLVLALLGFSALQWRKSSGTRPFG